MPVLILIVWMVAGCSVELQDVGDTSASQAETQMPELFPLSGPHFRILVGEKPNAYVVQVDPPADSTGVMRETADGENAFHLQTLKDTELKPGGTYVYRFLGSRVPPVIVTLPIDLVVSSSSMELSGDQRFRRVFFSEGSQIVTGGQDLRLMAEEIHLTSNSSIRSFQPSDRPVSGAMAKDGGKVQISASRIIGSLTIDLSGQAGADGSTGPAHREPAAKGPDAVSGFSLVRRVSDCKELKWGGRGLDGLIGQPGLPGGNGGGGGAAFILVQDMSQADIRFSSEGGLGGRGGLGGPGQPGGAPGQGEAGYTAIGVEPHEIQTFCPRANHGAGEAGSQGREGPAGREGSKGRLEINGQNIQW